MPWSISERNGEYCVVKDANGEVEGCHSTRSEANAQLAALHAAENKEINFIKSNGLGLPTDFDELESTLREFRLKEELGELLNNYAFLLNNVLDDGFNMDMFDKIDVVTSQFTDRLSSLKEIALSGEDVEEDDADEIETVGDVDPEQIINIVDDAIEMLDEISSNKSISDDEIITSPKIEDSGVFIYKDTIGTYRWIARYSNNIRDNDRPSEIISATSHKRFDRLVKSGVVEPPELWIWHEEDWNIGKAEWVAIDEVDGYTFTVAGGYIYPQFQHLAKSLSAQTKDMLVSHGMPKWSVKRDEDDASIIVEHVTKEISLLPYWAAANPYTGIVISNSKEHDMAFTQAEKARLMEKHNVSEELLDAISTLNNKDVEKASTLELETKDKVDTATEEVTSAEETTESIVDTETEVDVITDSDADSTVVLPNEIVQTLETVMKSVMVLSDRLDKGINDIRKEIDDLRVTDEQRVAEKAATSPLASLASMMVTSVIGEEAARVDGRTSLAKDKPVETPTGENYTGIPMIDGFISGQS